jgi:hypothetical protein
MGLKAIPSAYKGHIKLQTIFSSSDLATKEPGCEIASHHITQYNKIF